MTEIFTISIFCISLILCVAFDFSILFALGFGFFVFCGYGIYKKKSIKELFVMAFSGIKTVKNILFIFVLIGMMTALWRASGTIPIIVCFASDLIHPSIVILMIFLLNCAVSVLTGTAFGTSATMGVICMSIAISMNLNPVIAGGAVLSGVFFGDRCSPVSTSALLVSELTETNIFSNIKKMCYTSIGPFIITCMIYILFGVIFHASSGSVNIKELFENHFYLHWSAFLPAIAVILLSLFKVNVKVTMSVSILIAFVVCLVVQKMDIANLMKIMFFGFVSDDKEIASMLSGGGILSMVNVAAIVCISSSYSGLFNGTGLLDHAKELVIKSSDHLTTFGSIISVSVITSMTACNQTLSIMLTDQLCRDLENDNETFAISLENSVVVISPLIPWSIAGAVPIAAISAPSTCLFAACFLYILPVWQLASRSIFKRRPDIEESKNM